MNRYLTEQEERRLLQTVKSRSGLFARRDYHWMRLARNTGLRVGTLHGLTVADARAALASGYLAIRPEISKRKQAHKLFLNKVATRSLKALLLVRRDLLATCSAETPACDSEQALIVGRSGQALSVRSFQHAMRKWSQLAGLPVSASPHWWRHTLAMRIMRSSTAADPRGTVMSVLGHRSINSTAQYTGPSREDVECALREVSA